MIWSNDRRKELISWLMTNGKKEFYSALKTQKFLFFFESFSKLKGYDPDFSKLKAYKNGPVFSDLYGDYKYRFDELVDVVTQVTPISIDESLAKKAHFLTKIMDNGELSELTHQFDIWSIHEDDIQKGLAQIEMKESDFSASDWQLTNELFDMYDNTIIENSEVLVIGNKHFLFSKNDFRKLNEEQKNTLELISLEESLINPVYVEIGSEGELIID